MKSFLSLPSRCKVPIYTTNEFNLGLGVVGGLVVNGYDQGEAAARWHCASFRVKTPIDIPVMMTSPKRTVFDYKQMQKFRISRASFADRTVLSSTYRRRFTLNIKNGSMDLLWFLLHCC